MCGTDRRAARTDRIAPAATPALPGGRTGRDPAAHGTDPRLSEALLLSVLIAAIKLAPIALRLETIIALAIALLLRILLVAAVELVPIPLRFELMLALAEALLPILPVELLPVLAVAGLSDLDLAGDSSTGLLLSSSHS